MGMGSGVDQSRLNSSSPSSPGGKGGGSSSSQQSSSQPSSPGGKGGGYTPGAEPSPPYGGGAPTSPGGKGGGGYGPDDGPMPQQQYQQPFQQQFGRRGDFGTMDMPQRYGQQQQLPQQSQRPAFMDNPEFQGYQKQYDGLNQQMNEYMRQAPMYQQLQDLQGKMQGLQNPQPLTQMTGDPNNAVGRAAVMPQPGTPEFDQRFGATLFTGDQAREAEARGQQQRAQYDLERQQQRQLPQQFIDQMGIFTPDYYQQRGMPMDMPQRYGRQPQFPQYGQSGLGISQLGSMANMLRGNPMQQMQQQNPYQNPYQSQVQAAQQFNMQRANMANQQQRQLAQQYQRQQSQMTARKALEQAQGQYDFGSGAG